MKALNILLGGTILLALGGHLVLEHRNQQRLQVENQQLMREMEQRIAVSNAPRTGGTSSPVEAGLSSEQRHELMRLRNAYGAARRDQRELKQLQDDNHRLHSNWVAQLCRGQVRLSLEQVAPYLAAKQRSAESLVAAYQATGDRALLREALEKYPGDARVNLAAYLALKGDWTPEERRSRLDALQQADPANALAHYLSAQDLFKSGQTERAWKDLQTAMSAPGMQDYVRDFRQNAEETYALAGLSELEARMVAVEAQPLPHLAVLKDLGSSLVDCAKTFRQGGDEASAAAALRMSVELGAKVGDPSGQHSIIQELVAIAIQRQALGAMDPSSPWDSGGQTVKERLEELTQYREAIKGELQGGSDFVLERLSVEDQLSFYEKMKSSGELAARRWAMSRQSQP